MLHKTKERKKRFLKRKFLKKINRKKQKKLKKIRKKAVEINEEKIIAPKIFSISKNSKESIYILNKIKNHCNNSTRKVLLDMSEIEDVEIDVLMYLKYIVYEVQDQKLKNCIMSFIPPKDRSLRNFIYSSGFVKASPKSNFIDRENKKNYFLEKECQLLNRSRDQKFKIKRGDDVNTSINKEIVDFTKKNIKLKRTSSLYNMLSELMENTKIHAYTDESNIEHKNWFIFAEKNNDVISYVFLDTGSGIPKTIQKRLFENIWSKESEMLLSTLEGDDRTRTKKIYRGKGLPFIYKLYNEGEIKNLRIISNKACFNVNKNEDMIDELKGTFFYWEIKGEEINEV